MLGKHIRVEGCDFVVEVIGDLYTIRSDKMTYERMFDKENITVGDDTTFEQAVQFVEQCRSVLDKLRSKGKGDLVESLYVNTLDNVVSWGGCHYKNTDGKEEYIVPLETHPILAMRFLVDARNWLQHYKSDL